MERAYRKKPVVVEAVLISKSIYESDLPMWVKLWLLH